MGKKIIEALSVTRAVMFTAVVTVLCTDVLIDFVKKHEIKCPIKVEFKK